MCGQEAHLRIIHGRKEFECAQINFFTLVMAVYYCSIVCSRSRKSVTFRIWDHIDIHLCGPRCVAVK